MRGRLGILRTVAGTLAVAALASGCGGGDGTAKGTRVEAIPAAVLPPQVLGLVVDDEEAGKLMEGSEATYLDRIGLFSFRRGELLQATLQLSRFSDEAEWRQLDFRRKIARQILEAGAELPTYRMGDTTVYLATSARQTMAVWFDGPLLFVMAAREEYEAPRALLRELVKLEVKL